MHSAHDLTPFGEFQTIVYSLRKNDMEFFIANTASISKEQTELIVYGVFGIVAIGVLQIGTFTMKAIQTFRRKPPLHETFVSKAEFKKLEESIDGNFREVFKELRVTNRVLGRLEAQEQQIASAHKRIDNLETRVAVNQCKP